MKGIKAIGELLVIGFVGIVIIPILGWFYGLSYIFCMGIVGAAWASLMKEKEKEKNLE